MEGARRLEGIANGAEARLEADRLRVGFHALGPQQFQQESGLGRVGAAKDDGPATEGGGRLARFPDRTAPEAHSRGGRELEALHQSTSSSRYIARERGSAIMGSASSFQRA